MSQDDALLLVNFGALNYLYRSSSKASVINLGAIIIISLIIINLGAIIIIIIIIIIINVIEKSRLCEAEKECKHCQTEVISHK